LSEPFPADGVAVLVCCTAWTLPDTPRGSDLPVCRLAEVNTTSLLSMTPPSRLPGLPVVADSGLPGRQALGLGVIESTFALLAELSCNAL
jgi:hypothetical protein